MAHQATLLAVIQRLPDVHTITGLQIISGNGDSQIRITYQGRKFVIDGNLNVEQIVGMFRESNRYSQNIEAVLKKKRTTLEPVETLNDFFRMLVALPDKDTLQHIMIGLGLSEEGSLEELRDAWEKYLDLLEEHGEIVEIIWMHFGEEMKARYLAAYENNLKGTK